MDLSLSPDGPIVESRIFVPDVRGVPGMFSFGEKAIHNGFPGYVDDTPRNSSRLHRESIIKGSIRRRRRGVVKVNGATG